MKKEQITLDYHVSGSARQSIVRAIAKHTGEKSTYLGAPNFEYRVGGIIIGSQGEVTFPAGTKVTVITELAKAMHEAGFEADIPAMMAENAPKKVKATPKVKKASPAEEPADEGEKVALTVAVPLEKVNLDNLHAILESKDKLIQKALGIENTDLDANQNEVEFPWFENGLYTPAEIHAYTNFIGALCQMSLSQSRVTAKEKPTDNEKFTFRCFLIRLGFIGDEHKTDRKILLRNLSGNSAFKSGAKGVSA